MTDQNSNTSPPADEAGDKQQQQQQPSNSTSTLQLPDIGNISLPSSTDLPFTGKDGDPLHDSIKSAVAATNATLAQLEEQTNVASSNVLSKLRSVGRQARYLGQEAFVVYERRHSYGPQVVAGSAVAFGGLVALRRGRVPGFVVGALAGTGAYANVYGLPVFGLDGGNKKD